MSNAEEKHVLGLSGGRDSAALAVYMRQHHPELDIEYFFTDTGKELPEVYEFLGRLEGFLGKPILRLNPDRDFDFWLKQYNNFCLRLRPAGAHASSSYAPLSSGYVQCGRMA
jgi:3'-phosphoadenosine 5'-phosphosulfate sulfotransferase (PAPS reductase)/FAD synthetase